MPGVVVGFEACSDRSRIQAPGLAISREGHARLRRRAGDLGRQHGHRLFRLRARLRGVASYRNSVSEADLARNIDRELISYRALARYYVVTGKEDDAKAALAAEASLKDAIDQSMKGTTNPARLDQVTRLAREFRTFTKIFADILKVKRDSAL